MKYKDTVLMIERPFQKSAFSKPKKTNEGWYNCLSLLMKLFTHYPFIFKFLIFYRETIKSKNVIIKSLFKRLSSMA